jgi:hypothetical protein
MMKRKIKKREQNTAYKLENEVLGFSGAGQVFYNRNHEPCAGGLDT